METYDLTLTKAQLLAVQFALNAADRSSGSIIPVNEGFSREDLWEAQEEVGKALGNMMDDDE